MTSSSYEGCQSTAIRFVILFAEIFKTNGAFWYKKMHFIVRSLEKKKDVLEITENRTLKGDLYFELDYFANFGPFFHFANHLPMELAN